MHLCLGIGVSPTILHRPKMLKIWTKTDPICHLKILFGISDAQELAKFLQSNKIDKKHY